MRKSNLGIHNGVYWLSMVLILAAAGSSGFANQSNLAQENAELNEAQTQLLLEQIELTQNELKELQGGIENRLGELESKMDAFQKESKDNLEKEIKGLSDLVNGISGGSGKGKSGSKKKK